MNNKLSGLVDSRSRNLWEQLSKEYNIKLIDNHKGEYSVYTENKNAIIYVGNTICPDSFAHELLHIYLRAKDIHLAGPLTLSLPGYQRVSKFISAPLIEHIGNTLNLFDYYVRKCSAQNIIYFKTHLKSGTVYRREIVDQLIGKYLAIIADPNPSFDYSDALDAFKNLDAGLFQTLENLNENWSKIDIENYDIFYNYRDVIDSFYNELEEWAKNQIFI